MDVFTKAQRSAVMASVRGKDTTPEKSVRSLLHQLGFRFSLHRADLPGKPDIVLPRWRTAVFVHGCFWHQHRACPAAARPVSNRSYWNKKLDRNRARDASNSATLKKLGWKVIVIWECQLKHMGKVAARLSRLRDC